MAARLLPRWAACVAGGLDRGYDAGCEGGGSEEEDCGLRE